MRKFCLIALWIVTPSLVAAVNNDPLIELVNGLEPLARLNAHFKQVVHDESGKKLQESEGQFFVLRPGKFRWETQIPEQTLLVADGINVWNYDPDLEQVSVAPLKGQDNTPAVLLSGDTKKIGELFTVSYQKDCMAPMQRCYRLVPQQKDGMLQWLGVNFTGQGIASMQFQDQLGNTTDLIFTQVKNNPRFDAGLFNFKPPKGVDVIGNPLNTP